MDKEIMDVEAIRKSLLKLRGNRASLKALKEAPKGAKRAKGPLPEVSIESMISNMKAKKAGETK